MSQQFGELEWRISELEQQLRRMRAQIGALEVHVRELQSRKPPLGARNQSKESESLTDRAKSGKPY